MPKHDMAIVTGSSQGLGLAITQALLANRYTVVGLARTNPVDSGRIGGTEASGYRHVSFDLGELSSVAKVMALVFEKVKPAELRSLCLVNNAAVLEPLAALTEVSLGDFQRALDVNLMAPLMLSIEFTRRVRDWTCDRRIINVSSSLASRAMAGSGAYCISKAALEALNRQLCEEQQTSAHPVYCVSYRPGVVNTAMQKTLRTTPRNVLPRVDYFKSLHEKGELKSPERVAEQMLSELIQGSVRNGACYTFTSNGCEEVRP